MELLVKVPDKLIKYHFLDVTVEDSKKRFVNPYVMKAELILWLQHESINYDFLTDNADYYLKFHDVADLLHFKLKWF